MFDKCSAIELVPQASSVLIPSSNQSFLFVVVVLDFYLFGWLVLVFCYCCFCCCLGSMYFYFIFEKGPYCVALADLELFIFDQVALLWSKSASAGIKELPITMTSRSFLILQTFS